MSGVRGDARKRQQSEHLTHWDAGVRAVIEREVAKALAEQRERIAQAIDAEMWHFRRVTRADGGSPVVRAYDDAARIAREAGTQ